MNKEECLKAFKRLKGMMEPSPYEEDKGLLDYNDLKKCGAPIQNYFIDNIMVFERLIEEHFNPKPYKLEELKPNMLVWHNKYLSIIKIKSVYSITNIVEFYYAGRTARSKFEKDQFYPVTKYIQYQNEEE